MVNYADRKGRLVFADQRYTGPSAYIDRLEIECRATLPPVYSVTDPAEFAQALNGSVFSRSPDRWQVQTKAGWLFSGTLKLSRGRRGQSGLQIELVLSLNPTRFLQAHGVPTDLDRRAEVLADPSRSLRTNQSSRHVHFALRDARELTLDGNDNFLTRDDQLSGPVTHWQERTHEYILCVLQLIEIQIQLAGRSVVGRRMPPVELAGEDWRIRQVEFYWEYRTRDALAKVGAVSETAARVLRDSYRAQFPPRVGSEANSPYVAGSLDHQYVRAKLYAKTGDVARFEIAYLANPAKQASIPARRRRPGPISDLCALLPRLADDAARRADRFWRSFWIVHDPREGIEPAEIIGLVNHLQAAAEHSPLTAEQMLTLLLQRGGAEPFNSESYDPVRRLRRRGVLGRAEPRRRVRYPVASRYRSLLDHLRSVSDAAKEVETSEQGQLLSPGEDRRPTTRYRFRPINWQPFPPAVIS